MVTFIDPRHVKPKPHLGYCYRKAGWHEWGRTRKFDLIALGLTREELLDVEPVAPVGAQLSLEAML